MAEVCKADRIGVLCIKDVGVVYVLCSFRPCTAVSGILNLDSNEHE